MSNSPFSEFDETPQPKKPSRRSWDAPERSTHSGSKKEWNLSGHRGTHTRRGAESSKPSKSITRETTAKRSALDEKVWHDGELLKKSEVLRRVLGPASSTASSGGDSYKYEDVDEEVQRVNRAPAGRRLVFEEEAEEECFGNNEHQEERQRFYHEELNRHQNIIDRYRSKLREERQHTDHTLRENLVLESRYNGLKAEHEVLQRQHRDLQRVCAEQERAQQKLGEELCERERQVEELLEKNEELQSELFESKDLRNNGGPTFGACRGEGEQSNQEEHSVLEASNPDHEGNVDMGGAGVGVTPERMPESRPLPSEIPNAGLLPSWTSSRAQSPFVFAHPHHVDQSFKCTPEGRQQQLSSFFRCSQTCERDVFGMASPQKSPSVLPSPRPPTPNKRSDEEVQALKNQVADLQRRIDILGEVVEPIPGQISTINAILNGKGKENAPPEFEPTHVSTNQGSPQQRGEASPWTQEITDVVCDRIVDRLSTVLNAELRSNAESSKRGTMQKANHPETPAPRWTNAAGMGRDVSAPSSDSGAVGKSPWSDAVEVSRVNRQEMLDLHKRLTWQMQSVKRQS